MEAIWRAIQEALGLSAETISVGQMILRAIVTYVATLTMVRLGEKRFFSENTAFDLILGIILGSVVSRAINGSAPFFATLAAGFTLVAMHWAMATLSYHWSRFGTLVKGNPRRLVKDGEILWDAMRASHISRNDLMEALRSEGQVSDLGQVEEAWLERSGEISVLRASREPQVLDVQASEDVQTIRLQVE